ncbi:MAG: S8 family peptidase [Bernardetiaceae bacterium]
MMRWFAILCLIGLSVAVLGQDTHLIYFTDKNNNSFSLNRPSEFLSARALSRRERQGISLQASDLPVSPSYVAQVRNAGAAVRYTTRWLNGAIITADSATLERVRALPFVASGGQISFHFSMPCDAFSHLAADLSISDEDYGDAQRQNAMLGIDQMNAAGLDGNGMHVAVMDAGFGRIPEMSVFGRLRLGQTYDFVRGEENVFKGGSHGQRVLSAMAAYLPGTLVGGAHAATYHLFTTEDERSESRVEEAYWLIAAERADSLGVDVIISSLGYSDFDNPNYNYTPDDLDGKTALVTQAAAAAARTGMIVVTSAGNYGNRPWQKLTFPADADSILSVAAVDLNRVPAPFSSEGFVQNGRVKPDVAAIGVGTAVWAASDQVTFSSGTSFAAPLIAALATGLWQANPERNYMEIIEAIRRSGDQFFEPDEKLGYGIPHFERANAYAVLGLPDALTGVHVFPNPPQNGQVNIRWSDQQQGKDFIIQLFNSLGQAMQAPVAVRASDDDLRFALPPALPTGMYLLRLQSQQSQQQGTFRLYIR